MSEPSGTSGGAPYEVVLRAHAGWLSVDLHGVWRYRDLLSLLVWRDFVSKYKQTVLGPLWFILQPLLMTAVYTVIFGHAFDLSTDGLPPVLFYLSGQLGWNYFAQCLTANSATFITHAGIFSKVYFPRLIVPISVLVSNLFAFLVQGLTFFAFFVIFKILSNSGEFGADWHVVLLPLLVVHTAALSLGIALLTSALTAKYRDLIQLTTLLLQLWMYATPVIYPLSAFPAEWQWVIALNPMTPIVESYRFILLGVGTVAPWHLWWSIAATIGVLGLGLLLFTKIERTFVDNV